MFDLADVLKGVPNLGTSKKQLEYIKRELIDPDPNNFYSLTGIEELAAKLAKKPKQVLWAPCE